MRGEGQSMGVIISERGRQSTGVIISERGRTEYGSDNW